MSRATDNVLQTTHQVFGFASLEGDGKGCIFTATQYIGTGYVTDFFNSAVLSGCPSNSMRIGDCGGGSVALVQLPPSGSLRSIYLGKKNITGIPYYPADFLTFTSSPPRGN
jgi:hypothetical protein